jgi:hypothetical protein
MAAKTTSKRHLGDSIQKIDYLFESKRCKYSNSLKGNEQGIRRGESLVQYGSPFHRKMQL